MKTQQATGSVDARRAITGWLIRTVLFVPFIAAIMFWAAGTLNWLNAWVYALWYLVVSVVAVLLTEPPLLAERSNGRHAQGQA